MWENINFGNFINCGRLSSSLWVVLNAIYLFPLSHPEQPDLSGCFAYKDDDDDDDDGEFDSFLHFSMLYFHLSPLYHLVNLFHH